MAEKAVLTSSEHAALQALLVDPVVHNYHPAQPALETIQAAQQRYLGYLH